MPVKLKVLDLVPMWFRDKRPLRCLYWQQEELDAAFLEADQVARELGWPCR